MLGPDGRVVGFFELRERRTGQLARNEDARHDAHCPYISTATAPWALQPASLPGGRALGMPNSATSMPNAAMPAGDPEGELEATHERLVCGVHRGRRMTQQRV